MIFFVGNDGTIISGLPSPVYQGAANANTITVIAPFANGLSAAVAFQLPNGVATPAVPMTRQAVLDGIVNKDTGETYEGWTYALPSDITEYYGTVTAQFYFYAENSGAVTATSATSFQVGKGVPAVLPPEPSIDVYEQIMSNISSLQKQLNNGAFAARAIYAWNSAYTYGANEIVFYPDSGQFGSFVKSIIPINIFPPYNGGVLDTRYWEHVVDFDTISEAYFESIREAVDNAEKAQTEAEKSAAEAAQSAREAADAAAELEEYKDRILKPVNELPATGEPQFIYALIDPNDEHVFSLYVWEDGQWKSLGGANITTNYTVSYPRTLYAAQWQDKRQTITIQGMTEEDIVSVVPTDADSAKYMEAGITVTQLGSVLTITCKNQPSADISVKVTVTTLVNTPGAGQGGVNIVDLGELTPVGGAGELEAVGTITEEIIAQISKPGTFVKATIPEIGEVISPIFNLGNAYFGNCLTCESNYNYNFIFVFIDTGSMEVKFNGLNLPKLNPMELYQPFDANDYNDVYYSSLSDPTFMRMYSKKELPSGGTAGQILQKTSDGVAWSNGGGGANVSYDAENEEITIS